MGKNNSFPFRAERHKKRRCLFSEKTGREKSRILADIAEIKKPVCAEKADTGHRKQTKRQGFSAAQKSGIYRFLHTKNTESRFVFSSSIQTILSVLDFHQIMRLRARGLYRRSGISPCPEEFVIIFTSTV